MKNKTMKTVFKKGMTVYWGELKGEVVLSSNTGSYPVYVEFENQVNAIFTEQGSGILKTPPLLSLTPYTLNGFSQEPEIEKDKLVYVKNKAEKEWKIRYYSHKKNGLNYCFENQLKSCQTICVVQWDVVETENPLLK